MRHRLCVIDPEKPTCVTCEKFSKCWDRKKLKIWNFFLNFIWRWRWQRKDWLQFLLHFVYFFLILIFLCILHTYSLIYYLFGYRIHLFGLKDWRLKLKNIQSRASSCFDKTIKPILYTLLTLSIKELSLFLTSELTLTF